MAKTNTEKIADIQEQIAQLENRQKRLIQQQKEQERKDRTRRLCSRAGLLESILPDTIVLSDEQFKIFLKKTLLTDFTRRALTEIQSEHINPIQSKSVNSVQSRSGEREPDGATAQG